MEKEKTFWGIHAGKTGDAESLFEKKSVVALGSENTGDLSPFKTRDDFKKKYEQVYPNTRPGAIRVSAGQLYCFVISNLSANSLSFYRPAASTT